MNRLETPLMWACARLQTMVPQLQRLWHVLWRCEVRRALRRAARR